MRRKEDRRKVYDLDSRIVKLGIERRKKKRRKLDGKQWKR